MELLEAELNDPSSPRPPPLPPRPAAAISLPVMLSGATPEALAVTSPPAPRGAGDDEPRYVSSPRPPAPAAAKSAASVASQLRASGR